VPAPLANWNPARDVWETSHSHIDLFSELSAVYSETWPSWGTTRGGVAYELPTSAPLTDGSASSSSPGLLKTPTSQLAVNGGSQHPDKRKAGGHGPTLADEVEHLLPTPAVNDMGAAYTPETWDEWTAKMQAAHGNGNGHGKSLAIEAQRLLPTPTAMVHPAADTRDPAKRAASSHQTELSDIVRLLPGVTTSPPSDAGSD